MHYDKLKERNNFCLDNEDYPDNLDTCSRYSLAIKDCFCCCLYVCGVAFFGGGVVLSFSMHLSDIPGKEKLKTSINTRVCNPSTVIRVQAQGRLQLYDTETRILGYVRTCLMLFRCFELLMACHRVRKANTKHCFLFADPSSKSLDVSIQPGVIAQPEK